MSRLLRHPDGRTGKVHDIDPIKAGWSYVGFGLYRLAPGETAAEPTGDTEVILVLVEGKARIGCGDEDFGELGERMDVFDGTPPHAVYIPADSGWSATATTACTLAVCTAPAKPGRKAQVIGPVGIATAPRGKGANTRYVNAIAMEDRDVAESLLVTEVFTPQGNWSSYPPHRHDEDDFPRMTYLEETYYHRLKPASGFALQRVFTDDLSLDEALAVADHDVVLVPKGHHPCAAPYGFDLYYLNVMAGPLRKWRFENHPDFDWIYQRDQ
jgi:5-deoxy-glucuronate isomerase